MRFGLLLAVLLISIVSFGQKTYKVGKISWEFKKPANYKTRIDNFSSTAKKGDSVLKKNYNLEKQSNGEEILFSLAKSDSAVLNIIIGSYSDNSNIAKFTLKGYVDKLVEFMKLNYEQLQSEAHITTKEAFINNVKFYVIENRIYHKDKKLTYWTKMYIAEVSGKELNITVTYDNEVDKKSIETSIMTSKFRSL